MSAFEIPLSPRPQRMTIALNGVPYQLRFFYANVEEGGWMMDIADSAGKPLVCGVPLVTGADLLAQYATLGLGGKLFVVTEVDPAATPGYADLGVTSHLLWEPD